jgi:hypothetical protein
VLSRTSATTPTVTASHALATVTSKNRPFRIAQRNGRNCRSTERFANSMELRIPTSITDEMEPEKHNNIEKHEVTKKPATYRFTSGRSDAVASSRKPVMILRIRLGLSAISSRVFSHENNSIPIYSHLIRIEIMGGEIRRPSSLTPLTFSYRSATSRVLP